MRDSILKKITQNKLLAVLSCSIILTLFASMPVYAEDVWNFGYTGNVQTWEVPEDGTYEITVAGASGGGARDSDTTADEYNANFVMRRWPAGTNIQNYQSRQMVDLPARVDYMKGGHGAVLTGTYRLKAGTVLYINVGQQGTIMQADGSGGTATYNGGGAAGGPGAGSGGGATSIQTVSGTVENSNVTSNALIIAGGGGAIWSKPVGGKSAVEYPDPANLNNSLHAVAPGDQAMEYTKNKIQNMDWYFNPNGTGRGEDGKFIKAMFPGIKVENTGAVRAQISGSDIGAHTLMNDAYSGGGGGGYRGGNDGAVQSASGSIAGYSYFGPDKTKWDWEQTQNNVGQNVGGIQKLAPIGNGYAIIKRVEDIKQTLVINLGGYISKDGQNQIILQGAKGETVNISNLNYASGYSYLSYDIDTTTNNGNLWGSLSGSFASGQTATYTFGWNDDEITLSVKADLQIDTVRKSDGTHGTYIAATVHLRPDDRGKLFIVDAKEDGQSNYTPLYDDQFFGSTPQVYNYGYTGGVQQFTASVTGLYKVQLWGAGGGGWWWNSDTRCMPGDSGGTGGFYIKLNKGEKIYINVGGAGGRNTEIWNQHQGGWNGGGRGGPETAWTNQCGASGAGATSVQTTDRGELRNYAGAQGEVLAVVGGGAGGTSAELGWSGGPPGSITAQCSRGVDLPAGQNKQPHTSAWWVEGFCWYREIPGQFGQGASVPSDNYKDLKHSNSAYDRWGGAEPNPGGGGGWTGGWAYASEGPSSDTNAGSGSAYLTQSDKVTSQFNVGQAVGQQANGSATVALTTGYIDSDTITANFYDKAAPNIPFNGVIERNTSGTTVITWDRPNDNGSKYNLRVRRFATINGAVVDTKYQDLYVETGVAYYKWYIDPNPSGDVIQKYNQAANKGQVNVEKLDNVAVSYDGQYFHVAAVDHAGNIGPTATWKIPAVAYLRYDKNASDATGTMPDTAIRFGQSGEVADSAFTRPHYIFASWNTKPDGTGTQYTAGEEISYDFIIKTGQNVLTLYAQWDPLYILTVDPNGGLWSGLANKQTFEMAQQTTKMINDGTRVGYNFKGWMFNTEKPNGPIIRVP